MVLKSKNQGSNWAKLGEDPQVTPRPVINVGGKKESVNSLRRLAAQVRIQSRLHKLSSSGHTHHGASFVCPAQYIYFYLNQLPIFVS